MHLHRTTPIVCTLLGAGLLITSCKKELDTPPEQSLPVGSVITMSQLRAMFTGTPVHFDTAMSVYAVVTADETNGNLYKEVYVQDDDAGINVRLLFSGGLYQGDRVRIYLPGCVLSSYNGMLQLDSVDVDNNVVKQETDVHVAPRLVTVAEINPSLQGLLVTLDSVQFIDAEQGLPYADAVNQLDENRTLEDCNGDEIIVRNSGYANFASTILPVGRGPFTGVVGQFGSTMQLYIRDIEEVQLNGLRCDGSSGGPCPPAAEVLEDFTGVVQYDPVVLPCWKNLATSGSVLWEGGTFTGAYFARCEAYNSGETTNVMWLVSPPVTYTPGLMLSFLTEKAYWVADPFALLISTDFDGVSISGASWTTIPCTHATSSDVDYTWVPSGNIDLGAHLPLGYTGSFVVAFRYTGGDPGNTTRYDVDDVIIQLIESKDVGRDQAASKHTTTMKKPILLSLITALGFGAQAQVIFQNDFEAWTDTLPDSWVGAKTTLELDSIEQVTVNVQLGSSACRLTNAESGHKRFTTTQVTVVDGEVYEISFWVRGSGNIRTGLFDGRPSASGYATYNPYAAATSTWTQVTQSISAANDTTGAEFILSVQLSDPADHIVVDNVTISLGGTVNPPVAHSIHEIQYTTDVSGNSPLADSTVETGGIVTAAYASGFWIQNGTGPWTGLFVFTSAIAPVEGDSVIVSGSVTEFNGLTEINNVLDASIVSGGWAVPGSELLDIPETWEEQWESVLVSIENTVCTNANAGFGQWVVEDGNGDSLLVDDLIFAYTPIAGTLFDLTGPMYYSFNERKIEPRSAGDVIAGVGEVVPLDASVLPNPVSDELLVQWTGGSLRYTLADAKGRIVMQATAASAPLKLDVRGLADGLYTLSLQSDARSRTERIVVKH